MGFLRGCGPCAIMHLGRCVKPVHRVQAIAPLPNTQSHLLRIVSTLEKDFMKSQPPASVLDLEQYAEGTSSQLLYLQVHPSPISLHCHAEQADVVR